MHLWVFTKNCTLTINTHGRPFLLGGGDAVHCKGKAIPYVYIYVYRYVYLSLMRSNDHGPHELQSMFLAS